MNKLLVNILILIMSVLFSAQEAYSQASTGQTLRTSVQPAVAIEKISSVETGNLSAITGEIFGSLSSTFNLQVNDGESYDFIIYATLLTATDTVSAFDKNGDLLFSNNTNLPTNSAVENARANIEGNANVIGYPFEITLDENMSLNFTTDKTYSECYKVNLTNSATSGNLLQTISGAPTTNTYSLGEDLAGTYKATVYITAVAK